MSSHGYASPLILEPRPSRLLRALRCVAWGAATLALLLLATWWTGLFVVAAILAGFLDRHQSGRCRRLEWWPDGTWRLATSRGCQHLQLAPGTLCTRWLVVLVFRGHVVGKRRVIACDAVDPVTWRRLRVRLRTDGVGHAGEPRY